MKNGFSIIRIAALGLCLSAISFLSCSVDNRNYELTVINPDPLAAKVVLKDSDGEREIEGCWSKSYFTAEKISLRAEVNALPRSFFSGWRLGYPASSIVGTFAEWRLEHSASVSFTIGDDVWLAEPAFEYVYNSGPAWVTDDRVVFISNRDKGQGLWTISPTGTGAASRLTDPRDSFGMIPPAHAQDDVRLVAAWKGQPLVLGSLKRGERESFSVWNVATAAQVDLDESLFGSLEIGELQLVMLDPRGNMLCAFLNRRGLTDALTTLDLAWIPPSGAAKIAFTVNSGNWSMSADSACRYAFVIASDRAFSPGAQGFACVDLQTGTGSGWVAVDNLSAGAAISADGTKALALMEYLKSDMSPDGCKVFVLKSDGGYSVFPQAAGDNRLSLVASTIRFSADGTRFVGQGLDGVWRAHDATSGQLAETLSAMPSDLSPSWAQGLLSNGADSRYRFFNAADRVKPSGGESVSGMQNGRNTDLFVDDGNGGGRWITGPASGDVE